VRKRLKYILIALAVLVFALIGITGFLRINIDIGSILFGISAILAALIAYTLVSFYMKPKKELVIDSKVEFYSPTPIMKPFKSYRLSIKIEHRLEEKRKTRIVKTDKVEIKFNKDDHPDVYAYCLDLIQNTLNKSAMDAAKRFPNAVIIKEEIDIPEKLQSYLSK
jgi:hypothetical protein